MKKVYILACILCFTTGSAFANTMPSVPVMSQVSTSSNQNTNYNRPQNMQNPHPSQPPQWGAPPYWMYPRVINTIQYVNESENTTKDKYNKNDTDDNLLSGLYLKREELEKVKNDKELSSKERKAKIKKLNREISKLKKEIKKELDD